MTHNSRRKTNEFRWLVIGLSVLALATTKVTTATAAATTTTGIRSPFVEDENKLLTAEGESGSSNSGWTEIRIIDDIDNTNNIYDDGETATTTTAPEDDDDDDDDKDCSDKKSQKSTSRRLECWLYNLKIPIPKQTFRKDYVKLTIDHMECTQFQLTEILSSYHPSPSYINVTTNTSHHIPPSLGVNASGLSATCRGKYSSTGLSGNVRASVVTTDNHDGIVLHIQVLSSSSSSSSSSSFSSHDKEEEEEDSIPSSSSSSSSSIKILMPESVKTISCNTNLHVPHHGIHFSGSISARIIDLFSNTIASYISAALSSEQLCPLTSQYLDPTITQYLQQADNYLSQYLPTTTTTGSEGGERGGGGGVDTSSFSTQSSRRGSKATSSWTTEPSLVLLQDTDTDDYHSTNTTTITDAGTLPVIHFLLTTANQLLAKYLNRGFLNFPPFSQDYGILKKSNDEIHCQDNNDDDGDDCGYFFNGFAGILRSITGGNVTILTPRMLRNLTFELPYGATLELELDHLVLTGLDQVDELSVLEPTITTTTKSSPLNVLHNALTSERGWTIGTRLELKINTPNTAVAGNNDDAVSIPNHEDSFLSYPLEESFQVTVNISNIHAKANALVQVQDWNTTSLLVLVRAIQNIMDGVNTTDSIHCLVSTIQALELLEPDMVAQAIIESITIEPRNEQNHAAATTSTTTTTATTVITENETLEDGLDDLANNVFRLVLGEYPLFVTTVTEGILKGPARLFVNQYIKDLLTRWSSGGGSKSENGGVDKPGDIEFYNAMIDHSEKEAGYRSTDHSFCPSQTPKSTPEWINFTKMEFLNTMNRFLSHEGTLDSINGYLACLSKVVVNRHLPRLQRLLVPSGINAEGTNGTRPFSVRIRELDLVHLDSLKEVEIFSPSNAANGDDSTYLHSSIDWGRPPEDDGDDSLPQAFISLELSYPDYDMSAIVNVTAFLGNVQVVLGTRIDYDLNKLSNISVTDVFSHGQCAVVPAAEVRFVPTSSFTLGRVGMNLSALVTTSVDRIVPIDASTDLYPSVQEYATSAVNWSWDSARDMSNKLLEKLVVRALDLCEGVVPAYHVPDDDGDDTSNSSSLLSSIPRAVQWILGVIFLLLQVGILWLSAQSFRSQRQLTPEWQQAREPLLPSLQEHKEEEMGPAMLLLEERRPGEDILEPSFDKVQAQIDHQILNDVLERSRSESKLDSSPPGRPITGGKSLFRTSYGSNENSGVIVRHIVPMLVVGTIALLLSSNLSTGATVDLEVSLGAGDAGGAHGRKISIPSLFMFSLGNTASELFKAGSYPLFFLVVVFSGIWPYAKLLLMMKGWFMSTPYPKRREKLLLTLDALGKFSLVDTYVLVVMMVAFRYHVDLGEVAAVDVYVTPHYGFYGFLVATCVSLMVGHVMVHYHRHSQGHGKVDEGPNSKESLFDHEFDVQDNGPRRRLSRLFQLFLLVCSLLTVVFLALGFSKESFSFEFGGLAGLALGGRRSASYSLLSLGFSIPSSVEDPGNVGIRFLQLAYYFYAVVTPLACVLLLTILQIQPLSVPVQHSLLVLAEIANAWSAVEVFVLSIVAALLQISTFTAFIVGGRCDEINSLLLEYFGGEIPPGDAVCYNVEASVAPDCWFLVVGVLLNSFIVSVVLRFARCAMDERMSRSGILEQLRSPEVAASPNVSTTMQQSPNDDEIDNDSPVLVQSTIAKAMFRLPLSSVLFGDALYYSVGVREAGGQDGEVGEGEEEEEQPEWRYWF